MTKPRDIANLPNPNSLDGDSLIGESVAASKLELLSITNAQVAASAAVDASKVSFLQSGTGAVARTALDKMREVFSVKDFGALGNGSNDDRQEIQAAINAAIAAGGGTVYFPRGTYKITGFVGASTGPTQTTSVVLLGEAGTKISVENASYSAYGIFFQGSNWDTIGVENIYVEGNNKTATLIRLTPTAAEKVFVNLCEARNANAPDLPNVTTSSAGITIGGAKISSVTNSIVENVSRDALAPGGNNIDCSGINITVSDNALIQNCYIKNITHNNQGLQDADGIKVFSTRSSAGVYSRQEALVQGNTIIDCDGRFIKLQTSGNAVVTGNLCKLESAMTLIANWKGVDSQVANATVTYNTFYIGDTWSGGGSANLFSSQTPAAAGVTEAWEGFQQRWENNTAFVKKTMPYFFIGSTPQANVNAICALTVKNNIALSDNSLVTTTQSATAAFTDFWYLSSGTSVGDTTGQWLVDVSDNKVHTYNFIRFAFTQGDYTDKWFFYIYDNFKPSLGYSREIFYDGASSPYTSTCMIRDNHIGSGGGTMTWPVDLTKILNGSDWERGGQTIANAPASTTNSRFYRKGNTWGVQKSNALYTSGNGTAWTLIGP